MNDIKLKDVCKINMGQSPSSESYNEDGQGLPFFQGNADFGKKHPRVRLWSNSPIKIAEKNDILISVRAPIGALNLADTKCCIGRGLAAIEVHRYDRDYVYYYLQAKKESLISQGTGSTFKAISKKALEELVMPDVALSEQRRCSKILNKTNSVIDSYKTQLQKLDELVKSQFIHLTHLTRNAA